MIEYTLALIRILSRAMRKRAVLLSLAFITLLFTLSSCISEDAGEARSWESLSLAGKRLELIDDERIETYALAKEGWASTVIGYRHGAVTGPVMYWKIADGNLLLSESHDFDTIEAIPPPRVSGAILTVRRGLFETEKFRLSN